MASLSVLCDAAEEKLSAEQKLLAERETALEADREKLQAEKEAMMKAGITESDLLSINVGGQIFAVKRSTLLMAPEGSLLSLMFSGRWDASISRDAEGRMFLDMSPPVFSSILSYLRAMRLECPAKKRRSLPIDQMYEAELKAACLYDGLFPKPHMALQLKSREQQGLSIVEDEEGTTVRQTAGLFRAAFGTEVIETVATWKFSAVSISNGYMFAGTTAAADPSQNPYSSSSAFGWACDGQVYLGGTNYPGLGGWVGWQAGDHAIFLLDIEASTLKMYHSRTQTLHTLALPAEKKQWRLHVNLYGQADVVKLATPTAEEEEAILVASCGVCQCKAEVVRRLPSSNVACCGIGSQAWAAGDNNCSTGPGARHASHREG